MNRYLVIAFYENLGIKKRVTRYSSINDMYEYISGLRMCETPYLAFDTKSNKIIDIGLYGGYTKEKMIQVIDEEE